MDIREFCARHGSGPRGISQVLAEWQLDELDSMLAAIDRNSDSAIGAAVITADALAGDGLRDQIPTAVRDSLRELSGEQFASYDAVREKLRETLQDLSPSQIHGFISKYKGQVGENLFQTTIGDTAQLAESGSQQLWDISISAPNGTHEYVQVKLYESPSGIVRHMREAQARLRLPEPIVGVDGEIVTHVKFAVPEDISDDVRRLIADDDALAGMLHDVSIPISSADAAEFFHEGLQNVGPEQMSHFFDELLGGTLAAGSLHTLANAFLWYKGAKDFSQAMADAAVSTSLSSAGVGIGLLTETILDTVVLASAAGIGARFMLNRMVRSRWDFAEFMTNSVEELRRQVATLTTVHPVMASPSAS